MKARIAYAALFIVALPLLLAAWALRLDALLIIPELTSVPVGAAITLAGVLLMAMATRDLWVHGHGLPASPFPPERIVTQGTYGVIAHPVYVAAVLISAGLSITTGSGAGLWIVTPVLALAAAAFVIGFERDSTLRRYGTLPSPFLKLPPETDESPRTGDRAAVYALVLLPWVVLYLGVEALGVPRDARSTYFAWDGALPVIPWTEGAYLLTYLFVLLAPVVAARRRDLRQFALDGAWATALIIPFYLLVPLIAEAKPVPGDGFWQMLMRAERTGDSPLTAFPAFHVVWMCIAARAYTARWPGLRWLWLAIVAVVAASCVTTGMHSAADVLAGFAAYAFVVHRRVIWRMKCDFAEYLANSWREVSIGPIRVMSHSIYTSLGTTVGLTIGITLAGRESTGWLVAMTLAAIIGAGLWAQLVEGSPQLLRPYGYFGSVAGVIALTIAAALSHADAWMLGAVMGIGGSFAHAIGRGRCLVQGCCHGREAPEALGIRYNHPMTRVVRLSSMGGVPIHPTPLYAAVWTAFVGFALLRLWQLAFPLQFIVGAYFVLIGLGRFVEEHFRGEPQTTVIAGLRLYQWLAIEFIVGGAFLSTLGATPAPPSASFDWGILPITIAVGLVSHLAFGVDFPRSNRRFARLR